MSPKKKEKRIIRVKHPQLQKFRTTMREVLKAAYNIEWRRLHGQINLIKIQDFDLKIKEEDKIHSQIEELDRARRSAPIGCRVCGRQDLDLVYNPYGSEWFCESCYTFNQEAYKKDPHPYEPDWRKLFP